MNKTNIESITVSKLLKLIPDDLLATLSKDTKVDYQVKKLFGRNVFTLLLFGLIECERLGLRSLQDYYNSTHYKVLFNIPEHNTTKYNSLSARLATMNVEFFREAYNAIYEQCVELYDETDLSLNYKITRVDSTMVCQTAAKLEKGINVGSKKNGKKQIKYTICLTDMFPSSVEVFNQQCHISENLTIPKAIFNVIDKRQDNVFVFDRGVSDRSIFCKLDESDCRFVTRLKNNARIKVIEDRELEPETKVGDLTIVQDQLVYLYKSGTTIVEHPFRLITAKNDNGVPYLFLTNMLDAPIRDIIQIYKKRWDIEVFIRFIKQELNFSHFISVNENGITIILYMTMILAMLILIYKKINKLGYKTAKRRFMIEMWDIIAKMMIEYSGGDPNLVFRRSL
jgi:hypothetical protein